MTSNNLTLTIGRTKFTDWTALRLDRGIDRACTDFEIAVTDRGTESIPWASLPFTPITIALNDRLALTGYIDSFLPHGDDKSHAVNIAGRSKTADLIDCSADIKGGQFSGYALDAICRAVCAKFGITVIVETDVGEAFADVQLYRHETCFAFLERLCRLRGVLASDDENGNLVLTSAGARRAAGALREGENVHAYSATLSGAHRFSHYAVIGQHPVTDDVDGEDATEVEAGADDKGVPRYRPHVVSGESALTPAMAQRRAEWQARYNAARGTEATITVKGWQQPDGGLWKTNQIVPVKMNRFLKLERDLLIVRTGFRLDNQSGATTELTVGPAEGWAPDPGEVKMRKVKGTAPNWQDLQTIGPSK